MRNLEPTRHGLYDPSQEHDACGVGFVADLKGRKSHKIVADALQVLLNLMHRGACGCEKTTGDGAGILIQTPHAFLARKCAELGFELPDEGRYGVGVVFLPQDAAERAEIVRRFEEVVAEEGQRVLGWRDVPHDDSMIGATALAKKPAIRQIFVERSADLADPMDFERRLYVIRKRMEGEIRASKLRERDFFHVASLSYKTIVYKGMLTSDQVSPFFVDLRDPGLVSGMALVHSRFSTNTFPEWPLAQPFRMLCHNGEINTLRGNINWTRTREALMASPHFGPDLQKCFPICTPGASDSAIFDNVFELLVLAGRSLPEAISMMIPEAWDKHESMDEARRAYYHYSMCLMEPWDGPASIAFTDGRVFGAVLDRNGLRPSRYLVTKDGLLVMGSETGVLDIAPDSIERKGRLQPGRMFLVDTVEGRIVADEEIKSSLAGERPYGEWLAANLLPLEDLRAPYVPEPDHETVVHRQIAFGYTHEDLRLLMRPMAVEAKEALGSMGTDTPLAVLSKRPRPLYDYFKQLFAQVTNPPLDAIREELVTSVLTTLGSEGNLLDPRPGSSRHIELKSPILTNEELAKLRHVSAEGFHSVTLPMLFNPYEGGPGLERAMEELCERAAQAIRDGHNLVILSDRNMGAERTPIPALLATAGVHHHLIREGLRARAGLVIESGSPREVHHFCLLVGYGAGAVNPYLAFETLDDMIRQGIIKDVDHETAVRNYVKAVIKGIVKVMSKMGISTVQSYRGAQIFEAVGLNRAFVDKYFTWTASRIEGIGIDTIAREARARHERAYPERKLAVLPDLEWGGEYQWRRNGEFHQLNPETIAKLQHAVRAGSYKLFKDYTRSVDDFSKNVATLRGLFEFAPREPVPIEEVEPVEAIVRRFATGAMSFGSISKEAHETLAIAMNRLGGKSNTGEGGEDSARFEPDENGDLRRSAIKQVASGRFGVTSYYLTNADELQIKMAQGAKPGEGGQLPGKKVDEFIAKVRHSTPGVGLISPPPHHDIYSIEDLAQLIFDLKNANPGARISVKLVAEVGVGTVAAGVAKAHSDVVLISGHDGGTGASPLTSIKHAGAPWELGLAETQQTLVAQKLRDRITVQTDGQLKTGRDVVIAALLGAEEYGFASAALVAEGCIMMRVCHLNTCPVGIATQDPVLRSRFGGRPEYVVNFFRFIAEEVREHMARLGFRTMDEMIGRSDALETRKALEHWKAHGVDLTAIFARPANADETPTRRVIEQDHGIDKVLDHKLIQLARPALDKRKSVVARVAIRNTDRTAGTMLGHEVTKRFKDKGLPHDTIRFHFVGSAGQSFAAFTPKGMTMILEGDANDYLAKGLSGARVIVYPPWEATFAAEENVLIGNVAAYGATSGELYVRGLAGERFCVRNSGVKAVVEGIGDHGCEYMTGGRVVILGPTGRNFAAGMSGGIAYVHDPHHEFKGRCNLEMVELESVYDEEDRDTVFGLISRHAEYTHSPVAERILKEWEREVGKFVKVMPIEYRRVLEARKRKKGALKVREGVSD